MLSASDQSLHSGTPWRPPLLSARQQDDASRCLALFDLVQASLEVIERQCLERKRLQLAALEQPENFSVAIGDSRRHALAVIADLQAADFDILQQHIVHLERG